MKLVFQMLWPDPPLRSNKRLLWQHEHRIKRDIRQAGFIQGTNEKRAHMMLPGSHEWPRTPECRCGAEWNAWDDRCTNWPLTMPVHIRMVWSVPTKHRRDADSGQPTLKSWIDGIVSAGVLVDDDFQHVPRAWCEIEHCPGQPMSLRVEITPA